jgi:uncharacterized membrane protein
MGLQDYNIKDYKKSRGLWPVYGLVLAIALGAISYVLGPSLYDFVLTRSPDFNTGTYTREQVELFFAGIIFFVLLTIVALLVAVFVPRSKTTVKDAELVKERNDMEKARRARKKRQLKMDRQAREEYRRLE